MTARRQRKTAAVTGNRLGWASDRRGFMRTTALAIGAFLLERHGSPHRGNARGAPLVGGVNDLCQSGPDGGHADHRHVARLDL